MLSPNAFRLQVVSESKIYDYHGGMRQVLLTLMQLKLGYQGSTIDAEGFSVNSARDAKNIIFTRLKSSARVLFNNNPYRLNTIDPSFQSSHSKG